MGQAVVGSGHGTLVVLSVIHWTDCPKYSEVLKNTLMLKIGLFPYREISLSDTDGCLRLEDSLQYLYGTHFHFILRSAQTSLRQGAVPDP